MPKEAGKLHNSIQEGICCYFLNLLDTMPEGTVPLVAWILLQYHKLAKQVHCVAKQLMQAAAKLEAAAYCSVMTQPISSQGCCCQAH